MVTWNLPTFKGYTVDIRLKQFRKINGPSIIFIDFESAEGELLYSQYLKSLRPNEAEFKALLRRF